MKNVLAHLSLAALLGSAAYVSAAPVYYTFTGDVVSANAAGYSAGQQVSYTFMVDLAADGFVNYGGTPTYYTDYTDGANYTVDYFLSEYVGGDAIALDAQPGNYQYDYHIGYNETYYGSTYGVALGSNFDQSGLDYMEIVSTGFDANAWTLGQTGFQGYNVTYSTDGSTSSNVLSNLTLTGVNGVAPESVPEPSSLALIGLGLVGLMGFGATRKRLKA